MPFIFSSNLNDILFYFQLHFEIISDDQLFNFKCTAFSVFCISYWFPVSNYVFEFGQRRFKLIYYKYVEVLNSSISSLISSRVFYIFWAWRSNKTANIATFQLIYLPYLNRPWTMEYQVYGQHFQADLCFFSIRWLLIYIVDLFSSNFKFSRSCHSTSTYPTLWPAYFIFKLSRPIVNFELASVSQRLVKMCLVFADGIYDAVCQRS